MDEVYAFAGLAGAGTGPAGRRSGERGADAREVGDEEVELAVARLLVGRAQDRGGVDRRQHALGPRRVHPAAALLGDAEAGPEQGLRRGRAEANHGLRLDDVELGLQPRQARADLRLVGLGVDAPLPARLPLEVLHHVGDVDVAAVDAGLGQRAVEQLAGGPDERTPGEVFLV